MPITQPVSAQTLGPWAENLLIHLYLNADAVNADLESGVLDIANGPLATWWFDKFAVDRMSPLTKYWIDKWTGNPDITMRNYAEGGKVCFDLNNQRWPTGLTRPRNYDPATGTYKHYQDYSDPWEVKAREFRRALAYLSDKDGYIARIVKGYAYLMNTTVPYPCLARWVKRMDYPYHFNPATAAMVLDNAGFTQGTTPNPDYDNTQPWSAQKIRIDPKGDWSETGAPGGNLKPLIFYARLDDPLRSDAAKELTFMMRKSGIPVDLRIRASAECSDKVMNIYDYHLYTGGWSMDVHPSWVYFLYGSPAYWGGTATDFYGGGPGSVNYVGYCNDEYDMWSGQACFSIDPQEIYESVMMSQEIYARDCPVIDLWAAAAFAAYRSKWSCAVNMEEFGIANHWSFFEMKNTVWDTTIDWGIGSTLEGPHVVSAKSVYDRAIVDLVYEGFIALSPFNYAIDEEVGTTADFDNPLACGLYGTPPKSVITYHLRDDVFFHSGRLMTPYDAAFSLILLRDVGPSIYSYNGYVKNITYIEVQNNAPTDWATAHPHADIRSNPALGPNDVAVYFNVASMWARFWGSQYVMDSYIWLKANDKFGWSYGVKPYKYDTGSGPTPKGIIAYHPWEEDADTNGVMDMCEDGTGAWVMDGTSGGSAGTWTWVNFHAFRTPTDPASHYWSEEFVENFINLAFHNIGNVNYKGAVNELAYPSLDLVVDIADGSYIRNSFGAIPAWEHGTGFEKWNKDCDFDVNDEIYAPDLYLWGSSYGRVSG